MNNISKFNYWCHKILPLVYDDSISYYQFLCKVVAKLNEVIENVDEQNDVITQYGQTIEDYKAEMQNDFEGFVDEVTTITEEYKQSTDNSIEAFETTILGLIDGLVPSYSNESTYTIGSVVNYEGTVYKCITAVTEAEDFDSSKWEETVFTENVLDIIDDYETYMQNQYDQFLEDYQRTFGVVQVLGTSTTDVLSQKASTDNLNTKANLIVETETGNPIEITDGAEDIPVKSCVIKVLATQSGSGEAAPDNERTIVGLTGVTITANEDDTEVDWETEAGTVYGGELNVTTGELTITHMIYNLGAGSWTYNSSRTYFGRNFGNIKQTMSGQYPSMLCEIYKTGQTRQAQDWSTVANNTIGQASETNTVIIKDSRYTDADTFRQAVSGKYIVFELAEPSTTYQLDPVELKTILGDNEFSSTNGTITLQYGADIKLYIDKRLR